MSSVGFTGIVEVSNLALDLSQPIAASCKLSGKHGGDMLKRERHSEIIRLAREMAASGKYRGFRSIETRLRVKFPEARTVLDDDFLRKELVAACEGRSIYDV